MRRSRFSWLSWPVVASSFLWLKARRPDRWVMDAQPDRGSLSRWLERGSSWPSAAEGRYLPTQGRYVVRSRPPALPRGIERYDEATIERWKSLGYPCATYHFRPTSLIRRDDGSFASPTVRGRERLLDYETGHTLPAGKSSTANHQPNLALAVRASIIRDTYQCMNVSLLLSHLAHDWGYLSRSARPSEFRSRMVGHLRIVDANRVREGSTDELVCRPTEQLVRQITARCTGRGSDVRFVTGDLSSPRKISRQRWVRRFWRWKPVIANKW